MHRDRAVAAWAALERACLRSDRDGLVVSEPAHGLHRSRPAHAWPLSQVLHAAALLQAAGVPAPFDPLVRSLERYRAGAGFTATPGRGPRYVDDNAWIGLALVQGGRMAEARSVLGFVEQGRTSAGGFRWREDLPSAHACSTGSAGLLTLATGGPDPHALDVGEAALAFLEGPLHRADGLVADHVDGEGRLDPTAWAYNQGVAVGLHVELAARGRAVGDLERARTLAAATLGHFSVDDGLWRQPAAFTAVLLRLLLRLHAADGDPRWPRAVFGYVDRVWAEARDPTTGLFTEGGLGRYGDGVALDQAAVVQLLALRATPPEQWGLIR